MEASVDLHTALVRLTGYVLHLVSAPKGLENAAGDCDANHQD